MSSTTPAAVPLLPNEVEDESLLPPIVQHREGTLIDTATHWLQRLVLLALGFVLLAGLAAVVRRPRSEQSKPLAPPAEVPVPSHLPPPPIGAKLMLLQREGKAIPFIRSGPWAGNGVSNAKRAIVIQHGIGRDMDHAWRDVISALALEGEQDTLVISPNFYLASDQGRWFDSTVMHSWLDFDAWVGGSDAVGSTLSTYDLYDYLRAILLDPTRYPLLEEIVFAGHSGGGATMTRYSVVADDWTSQRVSVRYVVANSPSYLYFTPARPNGTCEGFDRYMYGLDQPVRYVHKKIAHLDPHSLARRFFSRPVVMLQGDQDTFERYPFGHYGCGVLAQSRDRRDRGYAYWVYKVLLSGTSIEHPRVGGEQRWKSISFHGREQLERSVERWSGYKDPWALQHDFCHVLKVGHVGDMMWRSKCGRAALMGREITEVVW